VPLPPAELAARLGVAFRDERLLSQALVHSSYVNEHADASVVANERLEFLGDSVLSLVISEALWRAHPDEPEGLLTTRRAAIVSTRGLARIAGRLDLGAYILLGQGAERSGERRRGSVLASAFEALVAAVYLDAGLEAARAVVHRAAARELEAVVAPLELKSPKSQLQELCYATTGRPPSYRVVDVSGPDHDRHYTVEVAVSGRVIGRGDGANRREAETEAATLALSALAATGAPSALSVPSAPETETPSVRREPDPDGPAAPPPAEGSAT
jgi:ribonuclease-3